MVLLILQILINKHIKISDIYDLNPNFMTLLWNIVSLLEII